VRALPPCNRSTPCGPWTKFFMPFSRTLFRREGARYSESGKNPNTLVRFDPKTETFQTWPIPSGGGVVRNMMATADGTFVLACSGVNRIALVEVKHSELCSISLISQLEKYKTSAQQRYRYTAQVVSWWVEISCLETGPQSARRSVVESESAAKATAGPVQCSAHADVGCGGVRQVPQFGCKTRGRALGGGQCLLRGNR
jgi:hypothetical protein